MDEKFSVSQAQKQKQALSQSLAMSIKLTELTGTDILSYLQNEALDNPLFDVVLPETCNHSLDDYNPDQDSHINRDSRSASCVIERTYANPEGSTLYDYLKNQVQLETGISEPLRHVVNYLISQLDESGFLRLDIAETARFYHIPPQILNQALAFLQSLDPAGIGARSLAECYILQLKRLKKKPERLEEVLAQYGEDLICKHMSKISQRLQIPTAQLYEMVEFLSRLSPAPGKQFTTDTAICVYPDVFLTFESGKPHLRYADENIPEITFHQDIFNEYGVMSDDVRHFARQRYAHYKYIQRALMMRRMTLLKVSTFIVRHQLDFFLDGSPLRPLTLKDIAAACHVSISTACRAVKNKYICTENGVYHLGYFLIREFSFSADSPAVSVAYIKQILADIIAKEDKSRPYSDYRLYDIFQSIHIPIARRTITKYRKALKIPDSRYRKKRT